MLLTLVVLCVVGGCESALLVQKQEIPRQCLQYQTHHPQGDGIAAASTACLMSQLPVDEEKADPAPYRCVEISPVHCPPNNTWVQEGSQCIHTRLHDWTFTCKFGKWTRTDDRLKLHVNREKRFLGFLVQFAAQVVVGVICHFFCGDGGSGGGGGGGGEPPNKEPTIECPADILVTAPKGKSVAVVSWSEPSATDPEDGTAPVRRMGGPVSGSDFPEGATYISYEAKDSKGFTDSCYFKVHVTVKTCSILRTPSHGRLPVCTGAPRENQYGAVCQFTCEQGYALNGQSSLTCEKSEEWSHSPPICTAVSCGSPSTVAGGAVTCSQGHSFPAFCVLTCKPGYRYTGAVFTACQSDGSWTPLQDCVDNEPPSFDHGCPPDQKDFTGPLGTPVTLTWNDSVTTDNSGETVTLTSQPASGSSFLSGFHLVRVTATDNAGNSDSCSFVITVEVRECPSLPVHNGLVTCSHRYVEGSECTITCNQGYQIKGQTTVTCQKNETWTSDPALPTCEIVTCPTKPSVDNGGLHCPGGSPYTFRSFCIMTCHTGYSVRGPSSITCAADGNWTQAGTCQDSVPPSFDCPDNIEVYASRLGQDTIVNWTSPSVIDNSGQDVIPTSDVMSGSSFPLGLTYVSYTATDSSNNSETCRFSVTVTTLSCETPDLEDPARTRSLMLYKCPNAYVHGAKCTLNCTYGYPLQGSNTITCERDDTQSPPLMSWAYNGSKPVCFENNCPQLDPPENGALNCLQGNFGKECQMACNENWDVVATFDGLFVCTNSRQYWEPSVVPDCQVAYLPTRAKLPSEFYYFTGSCNMSLTEIRENFINALSNSRWSDSCVNVPTCTAENVEVTCGSRTRRSAGNGQRTEEDGGDRHRRQAGTHYVKISFVLAMDYVLTGNSTQTYSEYKSKEQVIRTTFGSEADSGVFNLGSLTPDSRYIQVTSISFVGCPEGTISIQQQRSTKASCVGCSKGHYLDSTHCEECLVGQYTELDNATSCTPCPQGQSTLTTASDSSSLCQEFCTAGHFSPTGFVPCQPCPAGQYQSHDQSRSCDLCPSGMWTSQAGATNRDDCVAADVYLVPGVTLRSSLRSTQSSVTVSAWFQLRQNSSIILIFHLSSLPSFPLVVHAYTGDNSDSWKGLLTQLPVASLQASADQWTRVVFVAKAGENQMAIYHGDQHVVDVDLPSALTTFTARLTVDQTDGKAIISGIHGDGWAFSQENITASNFSCMGNNSDNLMTWTPQTTAVRIPSSCDAVDECQSSPCGSQGECENRPEGFQCRCQGGWSGVTCQVPPDVCDNNQCQNGATCVPAGHNYTCTCQLDYSGDLCQFDRVHGGWSDWGEWSQCSQTCRGQQQRQRLCNNPEPDNGGHNCTGDGNETRNCGEALCSVDGGWGSWGDWSVCSSECGGGKRIRFRFCDSPAPQDGGAVCKGRGVQVESCGTVPCPVHGGWRAWSHWGPCSVTCGGGLQSRERSCDNPVPAYGGQSCQGDLNQTQECNSAACPVCSSLPGEYTCSESFNPYRKKCTLNCGSGYGSSNPVVYTCGQETEYLWNFERSNIDTSVKISAQQCSPLKTGTSATMTMTVPYANAKCSQKQDIGHQAQQNLVNYLPCLQQNLCNIGAESSCGGITSNGRQKRSSDDSVVLTVNLTADLGASVTWSQNASSSFAQYGQRLSLVDQSAALMVINDTERLFTVTVDGQDIVPDVNQSSFSARLHCPPGSTALNGTCVDCPAGSQEQQGQCVLCPLGQYQDQPASASCKPCPPRRTWDSRGATHISQCFFATEEDHPDKRPELKIGILIAAILGGFVGVAVIVIITVFAIKGCKRSSKRVNPESALTTDTEKVKLELS